MNLIPAEWKFFPWFILITVTALLSGYGTWWVTSDYYIGIIARDQVAEDAATTQQLVHIKELNAAHDEKIRQAEEQHATDQLTINRLGSDLGGVRLQFPKSDCSAVPGTGQAATDSNGASGVATARIDEYLAEAQRAIQDIGQRCAQLNIDAIEANTKMGQTFNR